jgi:hypothetical protein
LDGVPGVFVPFVFDAVKFFFCDVGEVGGFSVPFSFDLDLEVGGEASNGEPFKISPSSLSAVSSAVFSLD